MPVIRLPSEHSIDYVPPRGQVLLLTCMDLRLPDDTAQFMDHDNLGNRYDQVILAGASLGALGAPGAKNENGDPIDMSHWRQTFFDHLQAAIELHNVEDVYILEHRRCVAYHKVFRVCKDFGDSKKEREEEAKVHLKYARKLEKAIGEWSKRHDKKLRVSKFLMDLRGTVHVLK